MIVAEKNRYSALLIGSTLPPPKLICVFISGGKRNIPTMLRIMLQAASAASVTEVGESLKFFMINQTARKKIFVYFSIS